MSIPAYALYRTQGSDATERMLKGVGTGRDVS